MKNEISTITSILSLYNQINSGEMKTKPYYQRRLVWTESDKEMFIDTILRDYPFPEIYILIMLLTANKG